MRAAGRPVRHRWWPPAALVQAQPDRCRYAEGGQADRGRAGGWRRGCRLAVRGFEGERVVAQPGDDLAQGVTADHVQAGQHHGLGRVASRDDRPGASGISRGEQGGQHAACGAQAAVQAQFGVEHAAVRGTGGDGAGGGEDGDRDGQVECTSAFGQAGGQQVDGDGAAGPGLAAVEDRSADAVAGLPVIAVGQAADGEGRRAVGDGGAGLDRVAVDADDGGCAGVPGVRAPWRGCGHDVLLPFGAQPGWRGWLARGGVGTGGRRHGAAQG